MNDNIPPKRKLPVKLIFVVLILGAFVGVFLRILTTPPQTKVEDTKDNIPKFKLVDLNDTQTLITDKDIKQNAPALVNIWASWCAPCRNEHKMITKLAKEHNVKIFGLNYKDSIENGLNFLKQYGNPYFKTMNDADGIATLDWGIRGVPETFVINKDGYIIHRHSGEIHEKDIKTLLEKLYPPINSDKKEKAD